MKNPYAGVDDAEVRRLRDVAQAGVERFLAENPQPTEGSEPATLEDWKSEAEFYLLDVFSAELASPPGNLTEEEYDACINSVWIEELNRRLPTLFPHPATIVFREHVQEREPLSPSRLSLMRSETAELAELAELLTLLPGPLAAATVTSGNGFAEEEALWRDVMRSIPGNQDWTSPSLDDELRDLTDREVTDLRSNANRLYPMVRLLDPKQRMAMALWSAGRRGEPDVLNLLIPAAARQ